MKQHTHYTIILGAEGELGKAMAREIARKKCNLLLVSTTNTDLLRFAIGLQLKEDVQVEALKLDLGDQESVQAFTEGIRSNYEIRALVNNITCDWSLAHNKCISELAPHDFMTRFRGAAFLTMGILQQMKKHPSSYVQHIIPVPFHKHEMSDEMQLSVSKMFGFARELEEELKDSSVSVSMVHPAPMRTLVPDFEVFDGLSGEINNLPSRLIAMKAVNGMLRGDKLIIPGFKNKLYYFLSRQSSRLLKHTEESLGLQPV